jgi:hypothetical protein
VHVECAFSGFSIIGSGRVGRRGYIWDTVRLRCGFMSTGLYTSYLTSLVINKKGVLHGSIKAGFS